MQNCASAMILMKMRRALAHTTKRKPLRKIENFSTHKMTLCTSTNRIPIKKYSNEREKDKPLLFGKV